MKENGNNFNWNKIFVSQILITLLFAINYGFTHVSEKRNAIIPNKRQMIIGNRTIEICRSSL